LTTEGSVVHFLLAKNMIASATGDQLAGHHVQNQFIRLATLAGQLQEEINAQVYRYYNPLPTKAELGRTWVPLLRWTRARAPKCLDIFTTNYDRVVESALEEVADLRIETGKRANIEVKIDSDLWRAPSAAAGLLTKLHGSVDWRVGTSADGQQVMRWGHQEYDGPHQHRGIIYPGFKGRPKNEPFRSFHEYLGRTAAVATHLLFVGFAFRDEYINELLAASLSPTAKIAVIDPVESLPGHDFLAGATHIRSPFGAQADVTSRAVGEPNTPAWLPELEAWAG
jgi:hypothetical protein